jgi:membrane-associated protease RseP (regulator of RpoE activity)
MRTIGGLLLFGLLLSGCQSGYKEFYVDSKGADAGKYLDATYTMATPEIYISSGDPKADVLAMFENGYGLVGYASFNGPLESVDGMVEQAREVGAHAVVAASQHTNTVTGAVPITTTRPVTTYSSGSVNAYSSGGSATGYYSGTSTSYVSTTTYVPTSVARYDQLAMFFAKLKPSCIGFMEADLSNEDRQATGTNSGVKIGAVRKGSPAFNADVLPGDIVLAVDDQKVTSGGDLLRFRSGQDIVFLVFRGGQKVEIALTTGTCQ